MFEDRRPCLPEVRPAIDVLDRRCHPGRFARHRGRGLSVGARRGDGTLRRRRCGLHSRLSGHARHRLAPTGQRGPHSNRWRSSGPTATKSALSSLLPPPDLPRQAELRARASTPAVASPTPAPGRWAVACSPVRRRLRHPMAVRSTLRHERHGHPDQLQHPTATTPWPAPSDPRPRPAGGHQSTDLAARTNAAGCVCTCSSNPNPTSTTETTSGQIPTGAVASDTTMPSYTRRTAQKVAQSKPIAPATGWTDLSLALACDLLTTPVCKAPRRVTAVACER